MKCSGINLTKELQNLYSENYKILLREIKGDLSKWKDIPSSWVRRFSIVKMFILSELISRVNAITMKSPACVSVEIYKWILKFTWKRKGPKIAKTILKEKQSWKFYNALCQDLL